MNSSRYRNIGLTLLFTGILIIIVTTLLFTLLTSFKTISVETGVSGCIIIFFIPICFAQGTPGILIYLLVLTIILVASLIILFILLNLINVFIYRKS
ncbi:MAG: hypothetical protein QXX35_01780 [Desulfurococcaceae archaeon]|uniref:DUF131 domain-containing protein n=2 Tax=Staphylothermus marinus TaxID=2280 RepID=A0A7C4D7B3_STAMA